MMTMSSSVPSPMYIGNLLCPGLYPLDRQRTIPAGRMCHSNDASTSVIVVVARQTEVSAAP